MNNLPLGKVLNEDCIKYMDKLPNECVDLIICDGPYGLNKGGWDELSQLPCSSIQEYNLLLIKKFSRILKSGGAVYLFGKPDCIDFIDYRPYLTLQSKIIWYCPASLAQGRISYTNNYDLISYFVKGKKPKVFNLEDIRVPQLTELTHRLRCEQVPSVKSGPYAKTKFNPKGKNPGDVWGDIKQLTYNSKELVDREALNVIQKPEKLMERLIKASSNKGDIVFDPFLGTGTTLVVCKRLGREAFGCEIDPSFVEKIKKRLSQDADLFD